MAAYQERLWPRLRDAGVEVDEDRIRQELVLFASKVDVDEELSRLATHLSETAAHPRQRRGASASGSTS